MQRKGVIINSGAEIWVPKDEVHDANKKLNLTIGWLSTGKCLNRKLQMRGLISVVVTPRVHHPRRVRILEVLPFI